LSVAALGERVADPVATVVPDVPVVIVEVPAIVVPVVIAVGTEVVAVNAVVGTIAAETAVDAVIAVSGDNGDLLSIKAAAGVTATPDEGIVTEDLNAGIGSVSTTLSVIRSLKLRPFRRYWKPSPSCAPIRGWRKCASSPPTVFTAAFSTREPKTKVWILCRWVKAPIAL